MLFFSYFLDEFWVFFSQDFSQKSHKTICVLISLVNKTLVSYRKISCPCPYENMKLISNRIQLLYSNTTIVFGRIKLIFTINSSKLTRLTNYTTSYKTCLPPSMLD